MNSNKGISIAVSIFLALAPELSFAYGPADLKAPELPPEVAPGEVQAEDNQGESVTVMPGEGGKVEKPAETDTSTSEGDQTETFEAQKLSPVLKSKVAPEATAESQVIIGMDTTQEGSQSAEIQVSDLPKDSSIQVQVADWAAQKVVGDEPHLTEDSTPIKIDFNSKQKDGNTTITITDATITESAEVTSEAPTADEAPTAPDNSIVVDTSDQTGIKAAMNGLYLDNGGKGLYGAGETRDTQFVGGARLDNFTTKAKAQIKAYLQDEIARNPDSEFLKTRFNNMESKNSRILIRVKLVDRADGRKDVVITKAEVRKERPAQSPRNRSARRNAPVASRRGNNPREGGRSANRRTQTGTKAQGTGRLDPRQSAQSGSPAWEGVKVEIEGLGGISEGTVRTPQNLFVVLGGGFQIELSGNADFGTGGGFIVADRAEITMKEGVNTSGIKYSGEPNNNSQVIPVTAILSDNAETNRSTIGVTLNEVAQGKDQINPGSIESFSIHGQTTQGKVFTLTITPQAEGGNVQVAQEGGGSDPLTRVVAITGVTFLAKNIGKIAVAISKFYFKNEKSNPPQVANSDEISPPQLTTEKPASAPMAKPEVGEAPTVADNKIPATASMQRAESPDSNQAPPKTSVQVKNMGEITEGSFRYPDGENIKRFFVISLNGDANFGSSPGPPSGTAIITFKNDVKITTNDGKDAQKNTVEVRAFFLDHSKYSDSTVTLDFKGINQGGDGITPNNIQSIIVTGNTLPDKGKGEPAEFKMVLIPQGEAVVSQGKQVVQKVNLFPTVKLISKTKSQPLFAPFQSEITVVPIETKNVIGRKKNSSDKPVEVNSKALKPQDKSVAQDNSAQFNWLATFWTKVLGN